jgi:uncharacterized protein (DUF1810 family)
MSDTDPFNLERFVSAQAPVLAAVVSELHSGRKRTHWMWFVFPQLRGLGSSPMATFYGIGSLDEACAFLAHPLLGSRLQRCTQAVLEIQGGSLRQVFGSPDDLKFQSSMTLFAVAATDPTSLFQRALDRWCSGTLDLQTLKLLDAAGRS